MRLRGTMGDSERPKSVQHAQEAPTVAQRALALAYALDRTLEAGRYRSAREAAEALGVTRARVSQVLGMLLFEAGEQEAILEGRARGRLRSAAGPSSASEP